MVRALLIIGAVSCVGCLDHGVFRCGADADCTSSGTTGTCEPTGFCSFADSTCPGSGRRYGLWAEPSLSLTCVPSGGAPGTVFEPFDWQGDHAFLFDDEGGAVSNTVWWDENRWDTRARTFWLGLQDKKESIAVERSTSAPTDGRPGTGPVEINGDGSPGAGVVRLGGWSVVSARLRNPALVDAQDPLVVDLFAERALGVGHAWELVLTPTATVLAAEYGVVAFGRLSHPVPSLALAIKTKAYYPCDYGWQQDLTLDTTLDTAGERSAEQSIDRSYPDDLDYLTHWRFEITAGGVEVLADLDDTGTLSPFASFAVSVTWPEVYVNLVASSTDWVDTDDTCGDYFRSERVVRFKNVTVTPVRYQETAVVPQQEGEVRVPIDAGWVGQDVRDLAHSGNAAGHSQPNERPYDQATSHAFCNGCANPVAEKSLHAAIDDVSGLARAQLLYDLHGAGAPTLTVNRRAVGTIPGRTGSEEVEPDEWMRFSVDVDVGLLQEGDNVLGVALPEGVYANTLQIELAYGDLTE